MRLRNPSGKFGGKVRKEICCRCRRSELCRRIVAIAAASIGYTDVSGQAAALRAGSTGFLHDEAIAMATTQCTDRVVGSILARWRYDISGISPEMRKDYEQHFAECAHCKSRQKLHRTIDVTLAVLTSLAALFFLFALSVLKHVRPLEHVAFNIFGLDIEDTYHMLISAGIAGLVFSVIAFALVLMATPAPSYLGSLAATRAKLLEERLPARIKPTRTR